MKIFAAGGPQTETNSFSPILTTLEMFQESYIAHQGEDPENKNFWALPNQIWSNLAKERGYNYIESLRAGAEPAGPVKKNVYEMLRDEVLEDLKKAMPVDMVLLNLHGAMIAEDYLDCEGDIITHIRHLIGPDIPIGVELDLHANVSDQMLHLANITVLFKEYPHTDVAECAKELFLLTEKIVKNEIFPVMVSVPCHMIGTYPTQLPLMREFVDHIKQLEKNMPGVLNISLAHGFPWGDSVDLTAKVIVTTDGQPELAKNLATTLARQWYEMRQASQIILPNIENAILEYKEHHLNYPSIPMTFGDFADNPGGGAPGDATFLLQAIMKENLTNVAFLSVWDPKVVELLKNKSLGESVEVAIGGHAGVTSGKPFVTEAKIIRKTTGLTQGFEGSILNLGNAIALEISKNIVIVNSARCQIYSPSILESMQFDLKDFSLFVVKSSVHFEKNFKKLGPTIKVGSPGTLSLDFKNLPYQYASKNQWPFLNNDKN